METVCIGLFIISITVTVLLMFDVRLLEAYLNATAQDRSLPSMRVFTPPALRAVELLGVLRARIHSHRWAVESREVTNVAIDCKELGGIEVSAVHEERAETRMYRAVLESLSKSFRSESSAILYSYRNGSGARSTILVTRNSKGRRFDRALLRFLEDERDCLDAPVLRDGLRSDDPAGEFSLFGIRYSLRFPFSQMSRDENFIGFLWLGYSYDHPPLELEIERGRKAAQRLGDELRSAQRIASLAQDCQEAEASSQHRESVMTQVSHDVRTPLSNVRTILSLLSLESLSGETRELLNIALRSCQNATDVLDEMVDFARLAVGKLEAHPRVIDLSLILHDLVSEFRIASELKGVLLMLEVNGTRSSVVSDPGHAKRSLSNVIGNAIKYTHAGTIRVSVVDDVRSILVRIVDTGVGMSEDETKRLFSPFERLSSSQGVGGHGLGLSITKALMELNQGEIHVASHQGRGTTVTLRFKAAECAQTTSARRNVTPDEHAPVRAMRDTISILIVDDDAECAASLARVLSRCGYKTFTAHHVSEAIGIINFSDPSIVITDGAMPEGGGRRILEYLQKAKPLIRVAIVTGDSTLSLANARSSWDDRAVMQFTKPVSLSELTQFIDGIEPEGDKKSIAG